MINLKVISTQKKAIFYNGYTFNLKKKETNHTRWRWNHRGCVFTFKIPKNICDSLNCDSVSIYGHNNYDLIPYRVNRHTLRN